MAARLAGFSCVAVAVSGGRDSVALLDYLARSGVYHGTLVAVHVNHRMRGEESDGDAAFVRHLAEQYGVKLYMHEVDVPSFCREHGYGAEQGARIVRRRIFDELVARGDAQRVLTAHHLSDQTESVLMHVFRGSGIDGLCGMREDDGVLFRPMLATPSSTLSAYVSERELEWRTDSTNADGAYSRNYLRNTVIPSIKKLYPSLEQNVARLSQAARDAASLTFEQSAGPTLSGGEALLDVVALEAHPALAAASVMKALALVGARVDAERVHVDSVIALKDKNNGARVCLPHFFVAERRQGQIAVFRDEEAKDLSEIPYGRGTFNIGKCVFCVSDERGGLMLDERKIPEGSVFRTRRDGDVFKKFKGGRKSLGDWLTDKKIPVSKRDKLALLAHGNEVLAIVGMEISDLVAVEQGFEVVWIKEEQ